jgi:8-oxo-dGTP pyrophosphatase MutT (NUDIX family)
MSGAPEALRRRLAASTHPLGTPPTEQPWNVAVLADLLPPIASLRPAAVLVPIMMRGTEPQIVLTRRTAALTHHAGQISFPGGRIERDDASPLAAALRESEEEIGLEPRLTEALGYLDPFVTITAFRVTPVVGLVSRRATFRPDPREVDEIFEAPLDFFLDPARCEERAREFQGRVRHYHVYTWGGREIWGATASMLLNLARRWQRAGEVA